MDAKTIRLVRTSWAAATAARADLASSFYARLFAADPALRPLFKGGMDEQAVKLTRMLDAVLGRLEDLDAFVPLLREMGVRHELYAVTEAHYQTVGDVLIETLAEVLDGGLSAEAEIAWATAYSLIARTMMSGARATYAGAMPLHPSTGGTAAA